MTLPYLKYALVKKTQGKYPRNFSKDDILQSEFERVDVLAKYEPSFLHGHSPESCKSIIERDIDILFEIHVAEWNSIDAGTSLTVEKYSRIGDTEFDTQLDKEQESRPNFVRWLNGSDQ